MTIQKIIIGGFVVLALVFAVLIFKLANDDKRHWIKEVAINAKIMSIREGYKGKPNYKIMELSDGQSFAIPTIILGKLVVGDSVFKQKGSDFYRFKNMKTQEETRTNWQ